MRKYHLEILTFVMVTMVLCSFIFCSDLGLIQQIMMGYMILYTLHEWEEIRFSGGFAKLMSKLFDIEVT